MVPRDFWTSHRIIQQKSHLLKQVKHSIDGHPPHSLNHVPEEVFASEALVAVNYMKADLNTITKKCQDITEDQQAKLLAVLKKHGPLFQGKHSNWKGQPVSIKVIDGTTPVWSKPYPTPLKNQNIFEEEVYHQCNIGALCKLSANKIEE